MCCLLCYFPIWPLDGTACNVDKKLRSIANKTILEQYPICFVILHPAVHNNGICYIPIWPLDGTTCNIDKNWESIANKTIFWTGFNTFCHIASGSAALSHASSAHRCLHLMDCLGPGIWRHTTKVRAVSSVSSPSGRWMAPLAMLTKTPGIFIIHWLSIAAQRYQNWTFSVKLFRHEKI